MARALLISLSLQGLPVKRFGLLQQAHFLQQPAKVLDVDEGVRMVVTEEEQSGHDPLKQLGSRPFANRRDEGSRTRCATGYEPVPGTIRSAAIRRNASRDP